MKKLILFDLDGTLVYTGSAGRTALNKAIKKLYGKEPKYEHSLISGCTDTQNFASVYKLIKGKKPSKAEIKKINDTYLELLPQEVAKSVKQKNYKFVPGIKKLLAALSKEKNIVIGLGTGNIKRGAEIKLEPSGLLKYFVCGGYGEDAHDRADMLKAAVKRAEKVQNQIYSGPSIYRRGYTS